MPVTSAVSTWVVVRPLVCPAPPVPFAALVGWRLPDLLPPYSGLQPFPIRSHRLLCGSLRWTLLHLMVESPTLVAQPHQALILKTNSYLITFRVRNPSSCWIDFSSGSLIRILMMRAWSDRNVFFIHLHYVPQSFTNLPASLFIHQIKWQSPHLEPYRKSWESHWVGCHTPFPSSEDQQDIVEAPRTVVQYPCQLAL